LAVKRREGEKEGESFFASTRIQLRGNKLDRLVRRKKSDETVVGSKLTEGRGDGGWDRMRALPGQRGGDHEEKEGNCKKEKKKEKKKD